MAATPFIACMILSRYVIIHSIRWRNKKPRHYDRVWVEKRLASIQAEFLSQGFVSLAVGFEIDFLLTGIVACFLGLLGNSIHDFCFEYVQHFVLRLFHGRSGHDGKPPVEASAME